MEQTMAGRVMFGFQYKHKDFLHGDQDMWMMWDEIYQLLQGEELGAQLICLWSLMQITLCEEHHIYYMAYLDPMVVRETNVKTQPQQMDDYIVNFLWEFQKKEYIYC